MDNVPLAAMLWSRDASFGGVMAFLGADIVAATVIWVHAKYYGWRYALCLSGLLYLYMVAAGITMHYLFALVGMIPTERPLAAADGPLRDRLHVLSEPRLLDRGRDASLAAFPRRR